MLSSTLNIYNRVPSIVHERCIFHIHHLLSSEKHVISIMVEWPSVTKVIPSVQSKANLTLPVPKDPSSKLPPAQVLRTYCATLS